MIQSFADRESADIYNGEESKRSRRLLPLQLHSKAAKKLDMLNSAVHLEDLKVPPGNRLELLEGELSGFHSIRINDQYRIVFRWESSGPAEVRICDYH